MKLTIDSNGWVVHATNLDLNHLDNTQSQALKQWPYSNLLVVLHNQKPLTLEQFHQFALKCFDGINNDLPAKDKIFVEGTNKEVIRVTGRKDHTGEVVGLFGMPDDLPWHCNEPGRTSHERPDALCLYGVENTQGSITMFSNSVLALQDLRLATDAPLGLLEQLDQIYCYYEYQGNTDDGPTANDTNYTGRTGYNKLVNSNKAGLVGIHWSPMQYPQFYIDNKPAGKRQQVLWYHYLLKFLTQPQYTYAHHWQDYEIIINCQWLSMHARPPFDRIEDRLLWRIMGYTTDFDSKGLIANNLPRYNV